VVILANQIQLLETVLSNLNAQLVDGIKIINVYRCRINEHARDIQVAGKGDLA